MKRNGFKLSPDKTGKDRGKYREKLKQRQEKTIFPCRRKEQLTVFHLEEKFFKERNENTVISTGKDNSVSHLPGKVKHVCRENLHTSLRSGSIFPQNLAGQDTELKNAHEITVCLQAK
jgi:hypothetical protein